MQLKLAVACILTVLFGSSSALAQTGQGAYEILENGAGKFAVDIAGAPVASGNVQSVMVEDLTIDEREMTTGADWDYRVYGPGDAHYGSITVRARTLPGTPSELSQWWNDCSTGASIRKNISVIIKKRDGTEARSYNFFDCFPVSYTPPDASSPDPTETIVVVPTGFSCDASLPDPAVREPTEVLNGFSVELGPSEGGSPGGVDDVLEHAQGGAIMKEKRALPFGDPADPTQVRLKGGKSVGEITLRGPMTSSRKALCQWITETVQGSDWKRSVAVTELKDAKARKTFEYLDCFPTRYTFPALSAAGTGNLYEEVSVKPIRLELK